MSCLYRPKDRDEGSEMEDDHEEEFYYTEVELGLHASSPPTLSHRDMARPPHEGRLIHHLAIEIMYSTIIRIQEPTQMIEMNNPKAECGVMRAR